MFPWCPSAEGYAKSIFSPFMHAALKGLAQQHQKTRLGDSTLHVQKQKTALRRFFVKFHIAVGDLTPS
jgi:hypothetical protein